ncbi:MAG: cation:proton antiporter [Chlorobi bacterium]|nr:cation:proton antiporter [Chlorobiota bacterium]
MKKAIVIFFLAVFGYFMAITFLSPEFEADRNRNGVKDFYLEKTVSDLKTANTVTAIVVNFRGFDTLGEVTVLFLAATALGSILFKKRHHIGERTVLYPASTIVGSGAKLIFPAIILLGAYVFIHGHLTPGGGFQGGTIIATGFLLMLISYRNFSISHNILSVIESLAGILFVVFGFMGLIYGGSFLENFMGTGILNDLFSGGVIPVIYILVGFKVAAELTGLIYTILHEKG